MKSLMGRTSNSESEMQGLANATCDDSIELHATRLKYCIVSVSSDIPMLTNGHIGFTVYGKIPADYIINISVTEIALGSDNIPAWC